LPSDRKFRSSTDWVGGYQSFIPDPSKPFTSTALQLPSWITSGTRADRRDGVRRCAFTGKLVADVGLVESVLEGHGWGHFDGFPNGTDGTLDAKWGSGRFTESNSEVFVFKITMQGLHDRKSNTFQRV
jgi:hypothetical protein